MVEYRDRDPQMPHIDPGHDPALRQPARLNPPVASGGIMRWLLGILVALVLLVMLLWAFGGGDSSVAPTADAPAEAPATAPAAPEPAPAN